LKLAEAEVRRQEEAILSEHIAEEVLAERMFKEMTSIEKELAFALKTQDEQDKQAQKLILIKTDVLINGARTECYENQKKINDVANKQSDEIAERVHNLQQNLRKEQKTRDVHYEEIAKNINGSLKKVQETIQTDRAIAHETENYLMRKIEEINLEMTHRVENERKERERNESQMLRILEEACAKFEDQLAQRN